MSEFTFSVRIGVDKELPPVSSGDYDVDFCSSSAGSQTPPKLQISLAAFGTATVEGVIAECYTVGTNAVTLVAVSPFDTAAQQYLYLRESSGHTAADIKIIMPFDGQTPIARMTDGDVSFYRLPETMTYAVQAVSVSTASTGSVQVVCIGD